MERWQCLGVVAFWRGPQTNILFVVCKKDCFILSFTLFVFMFFIDIDKKIKSRMVRNWMFKRHFTPNRFGRRVFYIMTKYIINFHYILKWYLLFKQGDEKEILTRFCDIVDINVWDENIKIQFIINSIFTLYCSQFLLSSRTKAAASAPIEQISHSSIWSQLPKHDLSLYLTTKATHTVSFVPPPL